MTAMYSSRASHGFRRRVTEFVFENRCKPVAKPIQRRPQRSTPFLIPSGAARVATAIRAPALHAVNATPGTIVDDLSHMVRRMLFQKFAIVRQRCDFAFLDLMQSLTERHFSVVVVVPVTLSIGRNVDQLRSFATSENPLISRSAKRLPSFSKPSKATPWEMGPS